MPKEFGKHFEKPDVEKTGEDKSEDFIELDESAPDILELVEPLADASATRNNEKPVHWERPKEEDLPIEERASFQKVELFGLKKNKGNFKINALADGSYILEYLDKNGKREEMYYFDKNGNLTEFRDPKYDLKDLQSTAGKIKKNLKRMNDLMIETLETEAIHSKKFYN
ncbi:MAG: hypothetical protein WC460_01355 [Patescibacteria group bacterium]